MKYYRVTQDLYIVDYTSGRHIKTLIEGELVTEKELMRFIPFKAIEGNIGYLFRERDTFKTNIELYPIFETVTISKNKTHTSFGVRKISSI